GSAGESAVGTRLGWSVDERSYGKYPPTGLPVGSGCRFFQPWRHWEPAAAGPTDEMYREQSRGSAARGPDAERKQGSAEDLARCWQSLPPAARPKRGAPTGPSF